MNGKILITGAYGNLGSWITQYLAKENYELFLLTREEKNKFECINYSVIECDITNLEELKKKLDKEFDYCIHLASCNEFFIDGYPKKALEINTLGTRNLLEVLSKKDLKNFIYFSTFHVYGENSGVITEETALNPKNDYASTHLFAEYYVKQFGFTHNLKYTILRLTNSYGSPTFIDSDKWYLVLNDLVKSAYQNKEIVIRGNGKAKRDFIFMGDVTQVVGRLLNIESTNQVYNLSSSKTYEILTLANFVKNIYEKRYGKNIELSINKEDKSVYKELIVKNDKLRSVINYDINESFEEEINKVFKLLKEKL